ncbi:MAG: J domain-containing protein [Bacteroidota bacterium]
MNSIIPDPHTQQLRRECEILGAELALLFTEHDVLVNTILPNIIADYQVKVGALELDKFSLEIEIRRLKKQIALMQEALNHGRLPDMTEIHARLDALMQEWQQQFDRKMEQLEEAQYRLKNLGDTEFSAEIRKLYRELVLKLHPDITRRTDERDAMLLQRAMAAYRIGDVEELRALKLLVDSTGEVQLPTQSDELQKQKNLLKERIETMLLKIEEVKNGSVYQLSKKLESPEWLAEKHAELHASIHELEVLKNNLSATADSMKP